MVRKILFMTHTFVLDAAIRKHRDMLRGRSRQRHIMAADYLTFQLRSIDREAFRLFQNTEFSHA
jgi:hypothetical protein